MLRAVTVTVVVLLASLAWGQANVDESQETASYWVDASSGSDSNPGTQAAPFQTIARAAAAAEANNQAGIGTQVNVNPGTYRESVTIASTLADTASPITIQAVIPGTAVLSGADVFGGWLPYSGTAIYTTAWPHQYGLCSADNGPAPFEEDIVLRRELFVVNGQVLTQVLSLNQMQPGTYFVDEAGGAAYVWPSSGTDMSKATVEVATRPELLSITGKSNMVIRGLTFRYAGSCRLDSAVPITASSNILLDGNSLYWNNSLGVSLSNVSYVTEQNNIASHNGNGGLADYETLYGYFSNNVTNYNNWRGAQGGYYRWSAAGFHPYGNHTSTIAGLVSAYNQAYGIHWDTDNQNITADSMILSENLLAEGFIEKSEGPLTISNSYMCNGNPNTGPVFLGFELRNSSKVTFIDDTWSNDLAALEIVDATGGVPVTDWQTGQLYSLSTQNISASGNTFVNGSNEFVFYDGGTNWSLFTPTLLSDYNNWWNSTDNTPFFTPNTSGGYTQLDLAGWRGVTGQDAHSTFVQPTSTYADKCYVPPESPDFWLVVDPLKNQLDVTSANSVSFATTIAAFGGFSGVVSLISDGVQNIPGATATWDTQTVNASGTATLTVQTSAATPTGVYPVTMVANSGDVTRSLTGTVLVNTTLGIDPLVANLGTVKLGSTSAKFIVVVNNFSPTTAITINSITATGDFSQTNTCGNSLAASTACAVTLAFTPTTVGLRTGSLVFSTSDPGSPQAVTLQGVGLGVPVLTITPTSLVFPDTDVKTGSQPSTVQLTNTGAVTLNISSISIGGQNQGDFSQSNGCNAPLAPGASCSISATFSPLYLGSRTANLSITSDASTLPQTAGLSGNGVAPVVTVSASNLAFGAQPLGLTSAALKSTLTNSGSGPLFISGITLGGTSPGDFAQTNDCPIAPASLAVGAACTLTVTFTPTVLGTRTAVITVADNVQTGNQSVFLSGTGGTPATVSLSPASLVLPSTDVRSTSSPSAVTLTNTGSGTLNITSIAVSGINQKDFAQTNTCGSSVAAGASCTILVTFSPQFTGSRAASLVVTDNASPATQTAALSGTGLAPTVSAVPATLGFGNQAQGQISAPLTSLITNTGTGPLIITSITLGGTNPGDFAATNTCPLSPATLAVGASCTISATFAPTVLGARRATVTVADNVVAGNLLITLSGTGVTPASAILSPTTLAFPATDVHSSSAPLISTLTNTGSGTLNITSILLSGANQGDFAQANTCGLSLVPGASCSITVTFTPAAVGTRLASITVTDNASPTTQVVSLTGTAVTPTMTLTPATLSFGNQAQNSTSAPLQSTVVNTGTGPLLITSITVTGANAADYAQTNTCPIAPASLAVNATCTVTVAFTPTALGVRSASVTVADNVLTGNPSLALTGTGTTSAAVTLLPGSLSFPNTNLNTPSAPLPLTLTNTGSGTLTINSITVAGVNASDYSQSNNCGTSLPALGTCVINVIFSPAVTGTRTANITVSDNASPATQTATLTGSGVTPIVSVTPSTLAFPSTTDNVTSAPLTTTLTDTGTGPLVISSIVVGGTNAPEFAATNTCPISPNSLAPGGSCTISATFTPAAMGTRTATITVNDNVPAGPKAIPLSGTGIGFLVKYSPTLIAFSSTTVGTTSAAKTVTLTNQGSISLNITAVSITGSNPGDFAQTNNCGTAVLPNASCTFTLTFTPTASGSRSAALSVSNNGDGSPQSVPLTGTRTQALASLSTASLSYGVQQYNTSGKTQTVTLTNTGNGNLTINAITFSGSNPTDFSQTNTCPLLPSTLGAGRACTITVTFTPLGMGVRQASLSIGDDAPASPQTVTLSGTGTFVKLTPTVLVFSSISVGRSSAGRVVTFSNVGTAALTVNAISITGTNATDFVQTNTCGPSIAAGTSCTVTVTFKPTALGTRNANLYFDDSDGAGPQTVPLTGTGI